MIYVHVAEVHGRGLPEEIQWAAVSITDPDARVLSMLGARGKNLAKTAVAESESSGAAAALGGAIGGTRTPTRLSTGT